MKGYLFPGQGSQYIGMGKILYSHSYQVRKMFEKADKILGIELTQIMLKGDQDTLKKTIVAQPAIFLYAVITAFISNDFYPDAVAGHSLGEIAALVASKVISFTDGLYLVKVRSRAMQKACILYPGTMVSILGLKNEIIEITCKKIIEEIVVPANYNCPGQLVISGTSAGISLAKEILNKVGPCKIISLQVSGGFHSPLMEYAKESFAYAVENIHFSKGICPIYQNINGLPVTDPKIIKKNLIQQLVSPIYWTQTINQMIKDGITEFVECGPGSVLQKLNRKIAPSLFST